MANPPPYTPSFDFSDFEASNPTVPKPGAQLDNEFENIALSMGATINAVKDIRRSDGQLVNEIVTPDSLSPEALALIGMGSNPPPEVFVVANNIDDVVLVADNMADVNLVADNMPVILDYEARYLGPKATPPTTRNDGSALHAGDQYFDTALGEQRVWDGSAWEQTATKVNVVVTPFVGNGTPGPYPLLIDPVNKANTIATIGPNVQLQSAYSVTTGASPSITFSANVPNGVAGQVQCFTPLPVGTTTADLTTASDGAGGGLFTTVQTFITRLMSSAGSALVGFIQAGTGAVLRAAQDKLRERVTLADFGATGDLTTDDTTKVQAALATNKPLTAASATGYKITGGLTSSANALISGEGLASALTVSGLSSSTDALRISPPADGNARAYAGLSGNYILQSSGGRHAVNVDVDAAGKVISQFICDRTYLRANSAGNYALKVTNATNTADRFFLSYFQNSVFDGGLNLDGVGDSINVTGNTLTGVNEALYFNQTTVASPGSGGGASSMLVFERNNSTANKGVYIVDAQGPKIRHNNLECGAGPGAGAEQALVNIKGLTQRVFGAEVVSNTLNHAPNCTTGVFLGTTDGALVENNNFGIAATGYGVVVSANSKNARIGYNAFSPTGTGREVQDLGIGTKGVLKNPTLLNSWVNYGAGVEVSSFIKGLDGFVRISGIIANGTVTANTPLFILPAGFRPSGRCFFSSYGFTSGGAYATVVIRVDTDGTVRLANSSAAAASLVELGLCGLQFFAPDVP